MRRTAIILATATLTVVALAACGDENRPQGQKAQTVTEKIIKKVGGGGSSGGGGGGGGGYSASGGGGGASVSGGGASSGGGGCEAGYDPCVPTYPPDIDCADLGSGWRKNADGGVSVTGSDPHLLDLDGDGSACEL